MATARQVACGACHCVSVSEDGTCYTWGNGDYGKLGHGDTTPQLLPRHLEFFRAMRLVWASGGAFHSAAVEEMVEVVTARVGVAMELAEWTAEGKAAGCGTPTAQPGRGSWETQCDRWSRTG